MHELIILLTTVLCINGHGISTMEQGRIQYELVKDRAEHPKYGTCWKQAVERIQVGCRHLTEDTQSDMALHLTDCFLEMSGHKSHDCQDNIKQNLRRICVSSMDDRAFNVYTEFYTHALEMCWFLQGQTWQEAAVEQMRSSIRNQEELLRNQEISLEYGRSLEGVLKGFAEVSRNHGDVLEVVGRSLGRLQGWIVGEIAWIDTALFYLCFAVFAMFFTANVRTEKARLVILFAAAGNILIERFICNLITGNTLDVAETHNIYTTYIWYLRYLLVSISVIILIVTVYNYKDYVAENNVLLQHIHRRVELIINKLYAEKHEEIYVSNSFINELKNDSDIGYESNTPEKILKPEFTSTPIRKRNVIQVHGNSRYNLRNRNTPEFYP